MKEIATRLIDLGRVRERLDKLCEHELFEWKTCRDKGAEEWFFSLSDDEKGACIYSLAYNISYVNEELHEIYSIARWGDPKED